MGEAGSRVLNEQGACDVVSLVTRDRFPHRPQKFMEIDKRFKHWDYHIDPRIEDLESKGFFLESFVLYSVTLEFCLQNSIKYQELWIKNILSKSKVAFKKTEKIEEKTLGQLIGIFSNYCSDGGLISKLNEFNSIRKKLFII
jgi:hypothetical protein